MKFRMSRAPVTGALLIIITTIFAFEWFNGALQDENALWRMGAIYHGMLTDGQYWRIISGMFLHGSILHWAANCWALYQLGMLFEIMFGSARFTLVYFVTGAIASIASSINLPVGGTSVGASGAILGILGAFIFSIRRSQWRHEPWTKGLLAQLVFWALINVALGFQVKQIDNVAHIAGLISGLLMGFLPHRVPPPPPGRTVVDVHPHDDGATLGFPQDQP